MSDSSMLQIIKPDWQAPPNIVAGVTTRKGGVSKIPYDNLNLGLHVGDAEADVRTNRRLLAGIFEPELRWQWLNQVHSNEVVRVERAAETMTADGLITATTDVACCVLTADCLSVFFAADDGSEVAVAHAGWRGLAAGILANTLHGMSTSASRVHVWFGPAIGVCHFEVGEEVRLTFLQAFGDGLLATDIAACFSPGASAGKYMADLYALSRLHLGSLGVLHMSGGSECTYCAENKYFSYRREGVTGRQLSFIYRKSAA